MALARTVWKSEMLFKAVSFDPLNGMYLAARRVPSASGLGGEQWHPVASTDVPGGCSRGRT